jgi:hypothetical protein
LVAEVRVNDNVMHVYTIPQSANLWGVTPKHIRDRNVTASIQPSCSM